MEEPGTVRSPTRGFSPEGELLLLCARTRMDPERAERIRDLLRGEIRWEPLVATANRHGVMPLLYQQLSATCPEAVPQPILSRLREQFHANLRRNFFLTGELVRLLRLLTAEGISAIPYKGPALAVSVYGSLALRQFGDLDIIIHRDHVVRARELLVARGYRPEFALTAAQEAAYLRSHCDYTFKRETGRMVVELHWALTPRYFSFPLDPARLWDRLEPLLLAGATVPNIPATDLLLVLCMHGSKHLWERLEWIAGVAELLRSLSDFDEAAILAQARALGSERMLLLGLRLARDLLGAPIPEGLALRLEGDPTVAALASDLSARLFTAPPGPPTVFENVSVHLRMRERLGDKGRYCFWRVVTPNEQDWTHWRLPASLALLHYLIRPIRIVGQYGLSRLTGRPVAPPPRHH